MDWTWFLFSCVLTLAALVGMVWAVLKAYAKRDWRWLMVATSIGLLAVSSGSLVVLLCIQSVHQASVEKAQTITVAPATPEPQNISGKAFPYILHAPELLEWKSQPDTLFDRLFVNQGLSFGVMTRKDHKGVEALFQSISKTFQTNAQGKKVEIGDTISEIIDNHRFLRFEVRDLSKGLRYLYTIYSGPQGSVALVGWSKSEDFEMHQETLNRLHRSFGFAVKGS